MKCLVFLTSIPTLTTFYQHRSHRRCRIDATTKISTLVIIPCWSNVLGTCCNLGTENVEVIFVAGVAVIAKLLWSDAVKLTESCSEIIFDHHMVVVLLVRRSSIKEILLHKETVRSTVFAKVFIVRKRRRSAGVFRRSVIW